MTTEPTTGSWNPDDLPDMVPDDYDFTIERAEYNYDEAYNIRSGFEQLQLIWHGFSPDYLEKERIMFSLGRGGRFGPWAREDDGARADHQRLKGFARNSWAGRLVARVSSPEDQGGLGMRELMESRGGSLEAGVWAGLSFHIMREAPEQSGSGFGSTIGSRKHDMPVAFLGEVEVSVAGDVAEVSGEIAESLTRLAVDSETLLAFQTEAFPMVTGDASLSDTVRDELLSQIGDSSERGFYARANAA